ncbi:hypothetical protein B7463_g5949, partial [Scytalidium lignicola]
MSANLFDTAHYYRFFNTLDGSNFTLTLGVKTDPPSPPTISPIRHTSENWQVFFDSGVYFIRNYDWGSQYQLGLPDNNSFVPQMLPTGVDLGMQWIITNTENGTWVLRNQLLSQADVLGVDPNAVDKTLPIMNTDPDGGQWLVDLNLPAGSITSSAMLATFSSIQSASSTFQPAQSTSATSSSSSSSSTSSSTSTPTVNPAQSTHSSQLNSLSSAAIGGIVIGGILGAGAIVSLGLLIFFCRSRRRKANAKAALDIEPKGQYFNATKIDQGTTQMSHELHNNTNKSAGRTELPTGMVPELMG